MVQAIDDLINNPRAFLSKNAIFVSSDINGGLFYPSVCSVGVGAIIGKRGNSGDITYIDIEIAAVFGETKRVCWLHYQNNQCVTIDIPANSTAEVFFTDLLTACSFGIRRYPNGTIRLAHSNLKVGTGVTDKIDGARNRAVLTGYTALHKEDYISGQDAGDKSEAALVYGVRTGQVWSVYVQKFQGWSLGSGTVKSVDVLATVGPKSNSCVML